ncbi:hypothetical protein V1504DRAFT_446374 [Lipomyces starkeyi]
MRSLTGTIEKAREPFPELYRKYDDVKKELTRLRRILRDAPRLGHEQPTSILHRCWRLISR